jgi:hypothetical protein
MHNGETGHDMSGAAGFRASSRRLDQAAHRPLSLVIAIGRTGTGGIAGREMGEGIGQKVEEGDIRAIEYAGNRL